MDEAPTKETALTPDKTATEILQENVTFSWREDLPDTFGGYTREQLLELVGYIGSIIGFTTEQAQLTTIYFGDDLAISLNTHSRINVGSCIKIYKDDELDHCIVVFNRSKEVSDYRLDIIKDGKIPLHEEHDLDQLTITHGMPELVAHLVTPEESIIWLISEELKHARTAFQLGIKTREREVDEKYLNQVRNSGHEHSMRYSLDIDELAASRMTLLILAKISRQNGRADREQIFKDLYNQSLESGRVVLPVFVGSPFILTGWDQTNIKRNIGQILRLSSQKIRETVFRFWDDEGYQR